MSKKSRMIFDSYVEKKLFTIFQAYKPIFIRLDRKFTRVSVCIVDTAQSKFKEKKVRKLIKSTN